LAAETPLPEPHSRRGGRRLPPADFIARRRQSCADRWRGPLGVWISIPHLRPL